MSSPRWGMSNFGRDSGNDLLNDFDRFHLVCDVIYRVLQLDAKAGCVKQAMRDKLIKHKQTSGSTAKICRK
jgi:phosphoketolase